MPPRGHSAGPSLNERRFRDVGKFSGDEGTWSEWSLKFRATVKECDVALFQSLDSASESEIEITKAHVKSISKDRPLEKSAVLCNRLIHLLAGKLGEHLETRLSAGCRGSGLCWAAHHDGSRRAERDHPRTRGSFAEVSAGQGKDGGVVGR